MFSDRGCVCVIMHSSVCCVFQVLNFRKGRKGEIFCRVAKGRELYPAPFVLCASTSGCPEKLWRPPPRKCSKPGWSSLL